MLQIRRSLMLINLPYQTLKLVVIVSAMDMLIRKSLIFGDNLLVYRLHTAVITKLIFILLEQLIFFVHLELKSVSLDRKRKMKKSEWKSSNI